MNVDKDLARRRFSRAARSYNMWCEPQRHMANELMSLLNGTPPPETVLELGCGDGLLTRMLLERYPGSRIFAIDIAPGMIDECRRRYDDSEHVSFSVGDAEDLQLDGQFDLIVSSSCFQWLTDLTVTLGRCADRLSKHGVLAFSAPTYGSLPEVRASYLTASGKEAGHRLPTVAEYSESILQAGLALEMLKVEKHEFLYDAPEQAVRALHGIGATRAVRNGHGLTPAQMKLMLQNYRDRFAREDGRVLCTYEVAYILTRRT